MKIVKTILKKGPHLIPNLRCSSIGVPDEEQTELGSKWGYKFGRHIVEITHPDKILFGKSGFTKQDLVDYYCAIAPIMLPQVKNRPISMQRFPHGIHEDIFFQKDAADYFPSWIQRYPITRQT